MEHAAKQHRKGLRRLRGLRRELPLHIMMMPALILLFIFSYYPMYGNILAFKDFNPGKGIIGSPWAGFKHFKMLFALPNIDRVFTNTISIAVLKIFFNTIVAIIIALMLNEVKSKFFRRSVQTFIYMPHFMSWVILGSIFTTMLGGDGVVNQILNRFGFDSVPFLMSNSAFRSTLIVTDVWRNVGFGTIVYLATITGIDPALYEAAEMDGAGRIRQTWHITLPGMRAIIVLIAILDLGKLLNAGFDQIFNMYNALVMESSDIIDTLVYRLGMQNAKYSLSTAVGLFKSIISLALISSSYYLSYRFADYRIF